MFSKSFINKYKKLQINQRIYKLYYLSDDVFQYVFSLIILINFAK